MSAPNLAAQLARAREEAIAEAPRIAESGDPVRAGYGRAVGALLPPFFDWWITELEASSGPRDSLLSLAEAMGALLANYGNVVSDNDAALIPWCDHMATLIAAFAKDKIGKGPKKTIGREDLR